MAGQLFTHLRSSLKQDVLVLTITEMLRKAKVVGKFVEFHGEGAASLSVTDRATIANMSPEYGATMGFFPVDAETLAYLQFTARSAEQIALVEAYCKEQMLFRTDQTPAPLSSRASGWVTKIRCLRRFTLIETTSVPE